MEAEFGQIVTAALLGTERQAFSPPAVDGALRDTLTEATSAAAGRKEVALLRCAGIASVYRVAGRITSTRTVSLPAPAEDDPTPICGRRAGELLGRILAGEHSDVLVEWLAAARRAAVRTPHRAIPALLDKAAAKKDLRDDVLAVIGRRGRWLMAQNPAWRFDEEGDAAQIWQTGSREARIAAMRRLRAADPAKARDLLKATWPQETPEDRAKFLETFAAGLSEADEELLESALDDKRKEVRKTAAELLARIPNSKLVARMTDRLSPLLTLSKTSRGKAVVSVKLPETCDKSMLRDGIDAKAQATGRQLKGEKQSWLSQMISYVPPEHWEKTWKLTPEACVAAAAGEFEEALLDGWSAACARHPQPDWIEPLIRRQFDRDREDAGAQLLSLLPPDRFSALAVDLLNEKDATLTTCGRIVAADVPFNKNAARALIRRMKQQLEKSKQAYSELWYALPRLGMLLPPEMTDEFAKETQDKPFEPVRRQVDELLAVLSFRNEVAKAF
jgi:hypothetical protein